MEPHDFTQLEACFARIVGYGQAMSKLDLSIAGHRHLALEHASSMLGVVLMYRHLLVCLERQELSRIAA